MAAIGYRRTTSSSVTSVPLAQKGVANGVATLDSAGKVPDAQLSSRIAYAVKAADTIRNNTQVAAADPDLLLPVEANARYWVSMILMITGVSSTGDFRAGWVAPAGMTGRWGPNRFMTSTSSGGSTPPALANIGDTVDLNATNNTFGVQLSGSFLVGATPGDLNFAWAQQVATVEDITLLAGSIMRAERVSP